MQTLVMLEVSSGPSGRSTGPPSPREVRVRPPSPAKTRARSCSSILIAALFLGTAAAGRGGGDGYVEFRDRVESRIPVQGHESMRRAYRLCESTGLLKRIFDLVEPRRSQTVGVRAADYFPFQHGTRYTYVDTVTDQEFEMQVDGSARVQGAPIWKVTRPVKFLPRPDFVTMSVTGDGVFMHQRQLSGALMTFAPAVKLCEARATPGARCVTTPAEVNPGTRSRLTWISRVESIETVEVPAGQFESLKIRLVIRDTKTGTKFSDVDLYYGRGVGLVKRRGFIFGGFGGEELKSCDLPRRRGAPLPGR
ncbi:MAG: hypothetical protein HY815_19580 [Candidatus Riflebacteria bacterium]|nr:hypothetical protein [Candidatus Riflebacteria bacterium]